MRLGEGPFCAHDPLGDGWDRDEESSRDFLGRKAAEDAKCERDASFLRQDRMASHEDEAEEIVPDLLVDRRVQVQAFLSPLEIASDLFVLSLERLAASDEVDRAVLRGPHEPGPWPLWHSICRPLLERGDERVLREILSSPDVADDASQPGYEPGRLDPPDRFDRAVRIGRCCLMATSAVGRLFIARTYVESSFTCPRTRGPREPRRSRRHRVPA